MYKSYRINRIKKRNTPEKKTWSEKIEPYVKISATAAAIFSVGFLYYQNNTLRNQLEIMSEQNEIIRKQNEITEHSFKESYRPIGFVLISDPDTTVYLINKDKTITMPYKNEFINQGKGILILIGWINYYSEKEINFTSKSLIENIKESIVDINNFKFDTRRQEGRYKPLITNEKDDILVEFSKIKPRKFTYLYSFFFYKDLDGNLYDTIYINKLMFSDKYINIIEDDSIKFEDKKKLLNNMRIDNVTNHFFHSYSEKEQNILYDYIASLKHPMADFIGRK